MKQYRTPSKLSAQEKWMTRRALESVERALYRRERGLPAEPIQPGEKFTIEPVPQPWEARRRRYLSEHGF